MSESSPAAASSRSDKKKPSLFFWGKIVAGVVLLSGVASAAYFGMKAVKNAQAAGGNSQTPVFAAEDWKERELHEVHLETPVAFGPMEDMRSTLSPAAQAVIDFSEVYHSQGSGSDFMVTVTRTKYAQSMSDSLDGQIQDLMAQAGGAFGDPDPKYSVQPIEVAGKEGRHASYQYKQESGHCRLETICVGENLWQVQVIYGHEDSATDADRILKSIQIKL